MSTKLLVVDDCADHIELLSYQLKRHGYGVLTAENGLEALNKARSDLPDLVLLDVMMPGMDGLTVCQILRVQPSTRSIPIIICTALREGTVRSDFVKAGVTDFLFKPFSFFDLASCIKRMLPSAPEPVTLGIRPS